MVAYLIVALLFLNVYFLCLPLKYLKDTRERLEKIEKSVVLKSETEESKKEVK